MSNINTEIRASFRERSYADGDVSSLQIALADLGRVETVPLRLPEAGGTWELWLNAKALVESVEAAIVYDLLKALLTRGVEWIRAARREGAFEPELHAVQASAKKLRVALRTSQGDVPMDLATAERIANMLPGEFPQELMLSRDIRAIVVEIPPEGEAENPRWLVAMGSDALTHEYSPKHRRFTVISNRQA